MMDECFRFLINVDQCLNMSMYDIFFYKLKNERKFRLNQLQDASETSFAKAFQDIHMYQNKFPYHFKEYQIIITMCSPRVKDMSDWESCLLRQLLQLNLSLHDAQMCMDAGPSADSALNLFLFHEAEPHCEQKQPENDQGSKRLENDCRLLLEHMAACSDLSAPKNDLKLLLQEYRNKKPEDRPVIAVLDRLINSCAEAAKEPVQILSEFFKNLFVNFNVIDLVQTHHQHHAARMNTGEMLRIVEYITAPVEHGTQHLSAGCMDRWNGVQKLDLETKYSDMLFVYEQMLKHAHKQLERDPLPVDRKTTKLPEDFYKRVDGIGIQDNAFKELEKTEAEMLVALNKFLQTKHQATTIRKAWEDTCSVMKKSLSQMENDLRSNAIEMGHRYSRRVETRKKEALHWKKERYFADGKTQGKIEVAEKKLEKYLNDLRGPDLIPSLEFEQKDNTQAALERADAQIRYYLDCLDTNNRTKYFILSCGALQLTAQHYIWLQPFSFGNIVSIQMVFATLVVLAAGMGLACILPRVYYRKAILNCARKLKKELDEYVPEYHDRTEQFRKYINTLDQLDKTGKLIEVYRDLLEHTRRLERGCLWHKTRIQDHLIKLGAFRSLIDSGNGRARTAAFDPDKCPTAELLTFRELNDIEQCCLYWPQGR